MVQWIKVLRKKGFVNPKRLPFVCEKTGALAIVESGFMAGRQGGWQAGSPAGC